MLFIKWPLPCRITSSTYKKGECSILWSWQPFTVSVSVCLPSAKALSVAATAECPLSIGKRPGSVTAAEWTSCFILFLPSYLLRHTICLPPCDSPCERGSDRTHGGVALDTAVDVHTCWHQWETVVCASRCVFDRATGTQTPPCGLYEHRGRLLFVVCVDRHICGWRTVKVRGCRVWDVAGQTQLGEQSKWNGMGPGLSCLAVPRRGLLA